MPKKRENILEKIVHKDYSNLLEKVIETKDFDEEVKNLLLSIFYKIDISYKDYKKVKRNVESKQEYIEKLIDTIKNNCDTIKIARPNSKEAEELGQRTFLVDNQNKKIICYPVERKLLYSVSKIGKQQEIIKNKHHIISKTLSNTINIGNNINSVEPLRDFNGWSWLIIRKEIENISYNLIYQNLRILVGEEFLNSWIANKEYLIDYYEEFKNELTEKFGEKISTKAIELLEKLSILLEIEINPEYEKNLEELQKQNQEKLLQFQDNEKFVETLTKDKKQINRRIKEIEKILSRKQVLEQEYSIINERLSSKEKIFSLKVFEKQLKKEKQKLLENLEEKNELLNPKKFIQQKTKLEETQEILKIIKVKDKIKEKTKILEEFQKTFLQSFLVFINTAETKEEIINLLYIFRYYNLLPFNEQIDIYENKAIQKQLKKVNEELLTKAIDYKVMTAISEDLEENTKILQFIFRTKIISLEDIYLTIIKEKDKYYVQFSEDNEKSYEEKYEIKTLKKEELNVKLNKKTKILD